MRQRWEHVEGWVALLVCALVFWLGIRAFDHPSNWPAPATPAQRHALEPLADR